MSRTTLLILALTILCAPSWSQEKNPEPKNPTKSNQTGYLKVRIVMNNESVFHGLVKKDLMVERVERYKYVKLKDDQKSVFGSGIRLWFYDGLAGFLFFHYRHIADVVVEREVSAVQLEVYEAKAKSGQSNRADASAKSAAKTVVAKKSGEEVAGLDAESQQLLTRWDPKSGWTEDKFADMQKRVITEGYKFSAEESEWNKVYPDWLKALRKSQAPVVQTPQKTAPKKTPAKAKLIVKKNETKPKKVNNPKSTITSDANGRLSPKIKRPTRAKKDTSGAKRGIK